MPRPKSAKPRYCLQPPDRAYVTLSGRRIYLGTHGSQDSRDAYDRVIGEWIASHRAAPPIDPRVEDRRRKAPPEPKGITVNEIVVRFMEYGRQHYRPKHWPEGKRPDGELGNFYDALKPLLRLYPRLPAVEFTPLKLKALREEMIGLKWCRNVINRQVLRVVHVWRWAAANELVDSRIVSALEMVDGLRAGRSTATESDRVGQVPEWMVDLVLPWLSDTLRTMFQLQILSGMRSEELCSMRRCDIDAGKAVWLYSPATHKTAWRGHSRKIWIGPRGQQLLDPYLTRDVQRFIFSPREAEDDRHERQRQSRQTPLTPSQERRAQESANRQRQRAPADKYSPASYRRAIQRACDRADQWAKGGRVIDNEERIIPRIHPHQARHSFASAIRREYGPDVALVLLGDRTTRMVDVYAEKDERTAEKIMASVG